MTDTNLTKYSNKKPYNNLPVPDGHYLVPFLIETWDEVTLMGYHRENLETWHFSGIPVLVAFTPATAEQFPVAMKHFWSSVRNRIAAYRADPLTLSYDKFIDDMLSVDAHGYDPARTESIENTTLLGIIIDELINEVNRMNPRYGRILQLLRQDCTKGEIITVMEEEYGIRKSRSYTDITAAQKLAKELYTSG